MSYICDMEENLDTKDYVSSRNFLKAFVLTNPLSINILDRVLGRLLVISIEPKHMLGFRVVGEKGSDAYFLLVTAIQI